jgi:hypothetical protein
MILLFSQVQVCLRIRCNGMFTVRGHGHFDAFMGPNKLERLNVVGVGRPPSHGINAYVIAGRGFRAEHIEFVRHIVRAL